ncbi:uncharacterized protein LOC106168712 [Lingula anatina]|uniref:Uncharacterized protein LOC106168712 n=1 Tax=Lingula anatina TaxID=7574 RepID=A0A1S3IZB5_LINAN|nr:uncharacterized protein LOC106168712 [Lingula anatina]XP_013403330.1 uncharacterized protein LOC106168712 [Lingula anatina]XP_013403331.1 uncharacterized protein LOC106168712 [Lingula anatina]XP_013403333.1 uncharacterized protein LOC106168712 [Lingula anatina]|eukprot:XP_013403329.1 uncharacterized protein LOC106168712 [Lingula anatina]
MCVKSVFWALALVIFIRAESTQECDWTRARMCFDGFLRVNMTSIMQPPVDIGRLCRLLRQIPNSLRCYHRATSECTPQQLHLLETMPRRLQGIADNYRLLCVQGCKVQKAAECFHGNVYRTFDRLTNGTSKEVYNVSLLMPPMEQIHISRACKERDRFRHILLCYKNYTENCIEEDLVALKSRHDLSHNMKNVYGSLCANPGCDDYHTRYAAMQDCAAKVYKAKPPDMCDTFIQGMSCQKAVAYGCFALHKMITLKDSMYQIYCKPVPVTEEVRTTTEDLEVQAQETMSLTARAAGLQSFLGTMSWVIIITILMIR